MSLIHAWLLVPLVLVAVGAGWGILAERAAGAVVADALLIPLGLAAALVVAGTFTAFSGTAPGAAPVVAAGGAVGLIWGRPWRRLWRWPMLAALGVLLAYGAPVILSGQATFTGFIRLDDTATWFNIVDHAFSHARSVSGEAPSTYRLLYTGDVGASYPFGAFMLAGVGHILSGTDIAWAFQPYMAMCAAALALCLYTFIHALVTSERLAAVLAFAAAQPALLYGYSMWGGIKELTAALMLALGVALAAPLLLRRPTRPRELVPLALAAGALIQTLGVGAGGWVAPALVLVAATWIWRDRRGGEVHRRLGPVRGSAISFGWLAALTAVFLVPVWVVLGDFLSNKGGLFAGLFSSGQTEATRIGNLLHPLSVFQLAGIWPIGDFRRTAPAVPSAVLITLAVVAAAIGIVLAVRRRAPGAALYLAVALAGCGAVYFSGGTPWVTGKALAISSPALLAAALAGAGALGTLHRSRPLTAVTGILLATALAGGAIWSNVLAYHDATLAPRARLAELAHLGPMLAGRGPTFINQYEVYADRHFLRAGAPVEPAEYRVPGLPLRSGAILTKAAAADLDSFPLSTLEPYPSLVIPRSPVESRPPSMYSLTWRGHYYELWQVPARPTWHVLEHVPLGESNTVPYCGQAEGGAFAPLCSADPVAIPPCATVLSLARRASAEHARLLAYQRPAPIVARGDQTLWPGRWIHDAAGRALIPTAPGAAVSHIAVASAQRYELWLGGSFSRGFQVRVDGRHVGAVKDELSSIDGYTPVADVFLKPGVHTFSLEYPHPNLTPGSGDNEMTSLSAIALEPREQPTSEMLEVDPARARELCDRPLDWIEIAMAS